MAGHLNARLSQARYALRVISDGASMKRVRLATVAAALVMFPVLASAQSPDGAPALGKCDPGLTLTELSPEAKDAVAGINAFSLDLYKRTLTPGENQFLSPASVSTAVALAYRGAVGQTADELRRVMRYDAAPDAYLRASAGVFATMNFCRPGRLLQTANAIWVQDGMPLKPDYVADVSDLMAAGLQRTDFSADPTKSRTDINAWVASATRDRITDLLQPGDVTGKTRAVLVNAIYWKGRWGIPFDADDTKTEPFTQLDGRKQPTPLMHQRHPFAVVERDGVQAIELPYEGGEASMVVFLPRSPEALPRFEAGLTDRQLTHWFDALEAAKPRDTILTLPKMHLEKRRELQDTLVAMGATTVFSDAADFSGMATSPDLKFTKVIHKAWLDVDEEGAEAAAATAVTMEIVVGAIKRVHEPPPIIFRADRPFLFVLRDERTGLILFIGRYVAPLAN
jgi:serpin B